MKINWFKININWITNDIREMLWDDILMHDLFFKFKIYLKIGENCKDCNNKYVWCICESYINYNSKYILQFLENFMNKNLSKFHISNISQSIE